MATIDAKLEDWADIEDLGWPVLFFGNGLSMNIWQGFGYDRLYDKAPLTAAAQTVFNEMKTTNFEAVLEGVMHAQVVVKALGKSTKPVDSLYGDVRDGLFEAVRLVHIRHSQLPVDTLHKVGKALDGFNAVFTTNYDLIPYWALMDTPKVRIADFFWSGSTFDPANANLHQGWTGLYFLHGGIHLWQDDRTGISGKWTSSGGGLLGLRRQFGSTATRRPLFVSEGSATAKRRTIRRSDYLTFALDSFREEARNTVVIGSAMAKPDEHIVSALEAGDPRTIAIAVRPGGRADQIIKFKAELLSSLHRHKLHFFDSTTHPLGDPALNVPMP